MELKLTKQELKDLKKIVNHYLDSTRWYEHRGPLDIEFYREVGRARKLCVQIKETS